MFKETWLSAGTRTCVLGIPQTAAEGKGIVHVASGCQLAFEDTVFHKRVGPVSLRRADVLL